MALRLGKLRTVQAWILLALGAHATAGWTQPAAPTAASPIAPATAAPSPTAQTGAGQGPAPAAEDPPFVQAFSEGNVVAYKRQPAGAVAVVVRVVAQAPDLVPSQLFAVAWDVASQAAWAPHVKRLSVLSQSPTEVLIYEQVDVPVVRDRDFVLRLRSLPADPTDPGTLRIEAGGTTHPAAPPDPQHIRMTDLWSSWTFRPRPGGGTVVTYDAYGDPAGALPGWLKRSASLRGPIDFVRALLQETRRRSSTTAR